MPRQIKADLGTKTVLVEHSTYKTIHEVMKGAGYNVDYCDICNIETEAEGHDTIVVHFKFVHFSVKSAASEPYYKLTLQLSSEPYAMSE